MAPGEKKSQQPRKRFYRARAHSNPLSDSHFPVPISPAHIDWSLHFPAFFKSPLEAESEKIDLMHKESTSDLEVNDKEFSRDCCSEECVSKDPSLNHEADFMENVSVKNPSEVANVQRGQPKVSFADIGCGFGGLLVKLSPMFPDTLMVGMELRDKVSEYVKDRIMALRKENPGQYQNISIIRTNAMKYLQNYFQKGQLQKMFFLFPDPHFKERNHRRRVISVALLAEYAHVMAVGGILYTITDVQDLGEWMKACLDAHPLFEEVSSQEQELDPVVTLLKRATEEGQKVERNSGDTFQSVYRRVASSSAGC
ncbi:hypothetical protein GOP47_0019527 [Adiantum capillus-veneris]|uniref:tRNA (guanine-N(7)-)-methyltransferase n=1 Tax=Adiantum capillus-veneris TaxID=13818 RepID=A0A9D4UBN3_ADICA|nr:hypothetical protein GOP47_0019527 [Adiantum capillus-veneris]